MLKPIISVIICTYNRSQDLEKVLKDLLEQELPGTFDYEIIVMDNNSTDNTEKLVNSLIPNSKGKLRYIKQSIKGKSNALNMGITHAEGEILAFTDDDVNVEKNWLASIAECFNKYDCDGIGGRVLPIYPENTPLWVRQNPRQIAGVVVSYDQGDNACPVNEKMERFIGCNWAFKSKVFKECGMFNTDLGPGTPIMGEDEEFYFNLLRNKKKLYYCPQMIIRHSVDLNRLSLKNAAKWHITLGRYLAYKQIHQGNDKFIYIFGVPRYIFRSLIISSFKLLVQFTNPLSFWNANRELFCNIGMIQQYKISKGQK